VHKRQGASTLKIIRTKNLRQKSKHTTSAETPRGFDLTNGPNQKTFGKKQTHNKCKNVGTSTLQVVQKKPTAKKQLEKIERRMPERGETFFLSEPSASFIQQTNETKPRI